MVMPILIADVGDVIGLIVTVVIIGFSVLSKLMNARAQGPAVPPLEPPGPAANRPPHLGGPIASPIETQIEDFLREVRGEPPRDQPPPAAKKVIEAIPVPQEPARPKEIVPGRRFGKELSEHVAEHIESDSISTRDAGLGDALELADERVEDRLHERFDHEIGQLAHVEDTHMDVREGTDAAAWEPQDAAPSPAARLRELLSSPQGVREAFLIAEIFKRPEI